MHVWLYIAPHKATQLRIKSTKDNTLNTHTHTHKHTVIALRIEQMLLLCVLCVCVPWGVCVTRCQRSPALCFCCLSLAIYQNGEKHKLPRMTHCVIMKLMKNINCEMHEKRTLTHTHPYTHIDTHRRRDKWASANLCLYVHCAKITDALLPCNASSALWDMIQHAQTCPPSKRAN